MAKVARLLERIIPEHYRLHLDVDMAEFRYHATEEITFELTQPGRSLTFHALRLRIGQAKLKTGAAAKATMHEATETVEFAFEAEIPAGKHVLELEFEGVLDESLHGFYRSQYHHDGQTKSLGTTQFEAVHAREAFVCVDEPAAKAVVELSLTVPAKLTAISNTNVVRETAVAGGRKRLDFAPSPKMSTYLAAWVIGELEYLEKTTDEGVVVRVYATPGKTSQLHFALNTAVRVLSFYNEFFDIPYPLPKLDMVAIPDFANGAMENWGLVTYRETALLLDPAKTSLANKQWVAEVVAHELAHQWFGNLVTMAWWSDLWLNEGFATWMEVFADDKLFPEWEKWTEFAEGNVANSMELDGLANTHPIQVEVDDPRSLDEIFDAVSYSKGSSIINMLYHYVGEAAFQKGLHNYLKRHAHGNTMTHDLWKALGEASGKPVDEVMSAWTSQPGYPLVSFEDGEARQRRFYSSPAEAAKADTGAERWPIPFSVRLADGSETKPMLIEKPAAELADEIVGSDWFKPNPGQTAFYRTHYTAGMIGALSPALHSGKLAAVDRFGVVNDVFATTAAGITDSMVALKLVEALRAETHHIVWNGVSGGFAAVDAVVESEPLRDRLDNFGKWLLEPNVERLGWLAQPDEPVFDTLMRPIVLQQAARYDNQAVIAEAHKRFAAYLEGEAMDPDIRAAVLYAVGRHGTPAEFDLILEQYRQEAVPQAKMAWLGALGRFRQPELIDRFLEFGLSGDVRPQDIYMIVAHGFHNRQARNKTWAWVQQHWDLFVKRYGAGGHMLERFPMYAASGFATHAKADELETFFKAHPQPGMGRPTAQAIEGLRLKADWYDRDKDKIVAFLNEWEAKQK